MDLHSGMPFWIAKNGLLNAFPRLRQSLHCDALVVGAGITGALIGDHLTRAGMNVCIIDRREAGWGSTSASTAQLHYEIDTELQELAKRYGVDDAVLAYKSCERAIGSLQALARGLEGVECPSRQSLYFASRKRHKGRLEREFALRRDNGFDLELLDQAAVLQRYGIDAPVALLTQVAAEVDPYLMAHALLRRVSDMGGRVHARTELLGFSGVRNGVRAETSDGAIIVCKHLIFAAGYESQSWLEQRVARNHSSYAFVSEPMPGGLAELDNTLIWESARPYFYLRRTEDERLLVGGEDDRVDLSFRREAKLRGKSKKLLQRTRELFPDLPVKIAFSWAGTFAETDDGLPFFGCHEQYGPRVHFAMAYGGNGITYSLIGAELLRDQLQGNRHPCATLFGFERLKRA
jgi:glycine/D-amino acid oxidase-like deaminating enzyme